MKDYILITDGAYSPKRDSGGFAFIFVKDDKVILEYSKQIKHTTNNAMEMLAIIMGMKCIKKPIDSLLIITDSQYCIGCAIKGWKRNKNIELWNLFDVEYNRICSLCPDVQFIHTRGHQSDESNITKWNNRCDELAVQASQRI
jgi:ribonuclease HI